MAQEFPSSEVSQDSSEPLLQTKAASQARFSPEKEKTLLEESAQSKAKANALFNSGNCQDALIQYDDALSSCPDYKHFERAVIHSNVAACHLKLDEWDAAAKAASKSLDALLAWERELGLIPEAKQPARTRTEEDTNQAAATRRKNKDEKESTNSSSSTTATKVDDAQNTDHVTEAEPPFVPADVPETTRNDIRRIRIKSLLRRGRARAEAGGWSNLSAAQDDYKTLSQIPGLAPADAKTVRTQLAALPPRTKAAQETEMSEMWGKLRQLGDGILKPFGLSTNNFQMVKDEATGGYSMNFQGNNGS